MEMKKIHDSHLDGIHTKMFDGCLEGRVTEIEKEDKKESVFVVETKKGNEKIKVPFKVKIPLGSKISYCQWEKHDDGRFEITGHVFSIEGWDPVGYSYKFIERRYSIEILDGEFEGIKYEGVACEKKNYK